MTKLYYKISEVSEALDVPVSTLRYWESVFPQLEPEYTPSGQRRYTEENIEIVKAIIHYLREEQLPLAKAQKAVANYRKYPPRHHLVCDSAEDALKHLIFIKSCTMELHSLARIEAIEEWLKQQI